MKTLKTLVVVASFGFLLTNANAQSFITNGLVAYYPFNGNANDASGNGHNGIVYGATLATNRFNTPNRAYYFTRSGWSPGTRLDEIYIPYSSAFNSTNISVSVWVLETADNSGEVILARYQYGYSNPNGETWAMGFGSTNNSTAWISGATYGTYDNVNSANVVPLNTWTHLVFTFDGQSFRIFANGKMIGTAIGSVPINVGGTSGISIGVSDQANGWWSPFEGIIDDVRIYNRALSTNEVAQLYALESAPIISVQKAVYLTSSNLWAGTNYQVQASTDLINWTNQGSVFTATANSWHSTNYWDVPNWNQLFFRLQQQ